MRTWCGVANDCPKQYVVLELAFYIITSLFLKISLAVFFLRIVSLPTITLFRCLC